MSSERISAKASLVSSTSSSHEDIELGLKADTEPIASLDKSSYSSGSSSDHEELEDYVRVKEPNAVSKFFSKWGKWIFCMIFLAYTIAACILCSQRDEFDQAIPLIVIWILYFLKRICTTFRTPVKKMIAKPYNAIAPKFDTPKKRKLFMAAVFGIFLICLIIFVVVVVIIQLNEPLRLVGFAGIAVLYLLGWACSKHRRKIHLRPVVGALIIQFVVGFLVMRTDVGYQTVAWISDIMGRFLGFVAAGSEFIFGGDLVPINPDFVSFESPDGETLFAIAPSPGDGTTIIEPAVTPAYCLHYFANMVIPTVIYFGAFSTMLYHFNLIQPMIKGIGTAFGGLLGTTTPESVNAAGNIFLGQTEAPLLVRPFLPDMTTSEIHAVMVGGFSTVSGGIMSAYMGLGIPAGFLISSVVMSSAGSLGMAKLLWPEVEKDNRTKKSVEEKIEMKAALNKTLYSGTNFANFIEAAAAGAADTVGLALNIGAMLIAFLSIIACFNALLDLLCSLVNISGPNGDPVTIELILGYIFAPIVYTMGVTEWSEAKIVGQFIGVKLMATEMTAYIQLSEYMAMNDTCAANLPGCDITKTLSDRAVLISSYALCGFGNFGSIGIMIGGLAPMAPHKRKAITTGVSRALVAGTLCNLMVATIAGIIEDPERSF